MIRKMLGQSVGWEQALGVPKRHWKTVETAVAVVMMDVPEDWKDHLDQTRVP